MRALDQAFQCAIKQWSGMMVSTTSLTGAAGEYYVMSQLLRHGFIAALAPAGVPNCDIVVTDLRGDKAFAIQVKTRQNKGSDGGWHMGKKHEALASPKLFYCFVDIGRTPTDAVSTFVVPAAVVARTLRDGHIAWLGKLGRGGKPHNDGDFRRFLPDYTHLAVEGCGPDWLEQYRNGWEQLQATH